MKAKYLLCAILLLASCAKEDKINVRESFVYSKFEFPQGDNDYDDKLVGIYDEFNVKCIYKDISRDDLNKSWYSGGSDVIGIYGKNIEDEKVLNFYATFLCDNIFPYFDPEITKSILPQYIYLVEDYYEKKANPFYPSDTVKYNKYYDGLHVRNYDGLDFWGICFRGEPHAGASGQKIQTLMPETVLDYIKFKEPFIKTIIQKCIDKKIIVQASFISIEGAPDIDFVSPVKNNIKEVDDPNYFKRRGFPETLRSTLNYANPATVTNSGSKVKITPSELFVDYIWLGVRYTKEQIYKNYAAFPLVIKYYDKMAEYMLTNYKLDLNAIAQDPELIPYQ